MSSPGFYGADASAEAGQFLFPRGEDVLVYVADHLIKAQRDNLAVRFEGTDQRDLRLLFGDLAMHFAGVELPDNADTPAWSRGVIEAFRRFTADPELFEKVTNAPYTRELASGMVFKESEPIEKNSEEAKTARNVKEKVARVGYLQHTMVPAGKLIQLEYTDTTPIKEHWFSKEKPVERLLNMKLIVIQNGLASWDVTLYQNAQIDSFGRPHNFTNPIGKTRKQEVSEVFKVVAIETENSHTADLTALVGEVVRVGQVTVGSHFKVDHNFQCNIKEVPGYEKPVTNDTLSLPFILQQAYLGTTREYPLL